MEAIIKTFKRRSSATDVLREIGVTPRDYDLFIEAQEGGTVALNISLAKSHVAKTADQVETAKPARRSALSDIAKTLTTDGPAPAPKPAKKGKASAKPANSAPWPYPTSSNFQKAMGTQPATKKEKKAATPKAPKEVKRTVTSVAREMIVAGKTNEEVWAVLKSEFNLDDGKKSYPAWYRRDCVKRGLIKAPKK